jgi:hypothetical protein
MIDRPWRFGGNSNLRFQDLEFYDSLKGFDPGVPFTPPPRPWGHFDANSGVGNQWINCVLHDVNNCWSGYAVNTVRGCIIWYVGNDILQHVVYPACSNFVGNVVAWVSGQTIELGTGGINVVSNIVWGEGMTTGSGDKEFLLCYGGTFVNNVVYEQQSNVGPLYHNGGSMVATGNKIAAPGGIAFQGNQTVTLTSNQIYATVYPVLKLLSAGGSLTANGNDYYSAGTVGVEVTNSWRTFANWKSAFPGLDTTSTASDTTLPPDSVTVYPNADESKRAHIAVFNWSGASNVTVSLAGVLNAGDTYQLLSAQNYGAGAIQTGTYNGTSISVPMTNLTTAPLLYGTAKWGLIQPTVTSPQFAAFVVAKMGLGPTNLRAMAPK